MKIHHHLAVTAALVAGAQAYDPEMVCVGCTVVSSLSQEGADFPWRDLEAACDHHNPSEPASLHAQQAARCKSIVRRLRDASRADTDDNESPDQICQDMGLCDGTCMLYNTTLGPAWPLDSLPPAPPTWPTQDVKPTTISGEADVAPAAPKITKWFENMGKYLSVGDGIADDYIACNRTDLYCIADRFASYHYPLTDLDQDRFNDFRYGTLRGYHWRGRDCEAKHSDMYPGRKTVPAHAGANTDHDCNGISGLDEETGKTYEELYCSGTERRGIVNLGDSATAHFHVPPAWLTATGWNASQVFSLDSRLRCEDELDVPYCSWGTGHMEAEQCPYSFGSNVSSLYKHLVQRNQCNHRDFQNIGVNGARISSSLPLAESLARDAQDDHPLLVVLALIGNDVCNGHPGSDHMTTVDDFYTHAMETLTHLDSKVPPGSYVMTVGLVDGRVLWDNMHDRQHPLGPTYAQFYEFLSCTGENPCWGWLNPDESWRNFTTERAMNLTNVYYEIQANTTFENFTQIVYWPDMNTLIQEYVDETGGDASDVIEPSDGFHPSQLGNSLLADEMWQYLEENYPEAIGDVNPFNTQIVDVFGDQGGY